LLLVLLGMVALLVLALGGGDPEPAAEDESAPPPAPAAMERPRPRRTRPVQPPAPPRLPGVDPQPETEAPPPVPAAVVDTRAHERRGTIAAMETHIQKRQKERDAVIMKLRDATGLNREQLEALKVRARDLEKIIADGHGRIIRLKRGEE